MLKVMMLLKRKPGLSLDEFKERYEKQHVPLAEQNVRRVDRYVRHYLHPTAYVLNGDDPGEPEYDVITELWYDDMDAFLEPQQALRDNPDVMAAVIADEETLFDRSKSRVVIVEDHESDLSALRGPNAGTTPAPDARDLQRLLDKDAIVDLVHQYSYCVDHKLHDEVVALFTEDCVVDYGPGVAPPARGRTAFRAMFGSGAPPTEARPGFVATSHHNANVLVAFDTDDRATVRTSMYAWHRTTAGTAPEMWGYYHDVVVRTSDGWRFSERRLHVLGNEGWDVEWYPSEHTSPAIVGPPGRGSANAVR